MHALAGRCGCLWICMGWVCVCVRARVCVLVYWIMFHMIFSLNKTLSIRTLSTLIYIHLSHLRNRLSRIFFRINTACARKSVCHSITRYRYGEKYPDLTCFRGITKQHLWAARFPSAGQAVKGMYSLDLPFLALRCFISRIQHVWLASRIFQLQHKHRPSAALCNLVVRNIFVQDSDCLDTSIFSTFLECQNNHVTRFLRGNVEIYRLVNWLISDFLLFLLVCF